MSLEADFGCSPSSRSIDAPNFGVVPSKHFFLSEPLISVAFSLLSAKLFFLKLPLRLTFLFLFGLKVDPRAASLGSYPIIQFSTSPSILEPKYLPLFRHSHGRVILFVPIEWVSFIYPD